jgi:hypothetical protein
MIRIHVKTDPHQARHARSPRRPRCLAARIIAPALFALAAPIAQAGAGGDTLARASIDELKRAYLACNRAALGSLLDRAGVMQCSVIYEALKQHAFGGDFDKLYAWSRQIPMPQDTAR